MLRKFVILIAVSMALVYLLYRGLYTLNLESGYAIFASLLLYVAEFYGCVQLFMFFFEVWDTHSPEPVPILPDRTVDVFIPTYNEEVDLLRGTIAACKAMDYPNKTYVLDDGRYCQELCMA